MPMFKLGFIINPIAGIGGSVALKGSDGEGIAEQAIALGAQPMANARAKQALSVLLPYKNELTLYTVSGDMGETLAKELGFNYQIVYRSPTAQTCFKDTENAVDSLISTGIDLLLFAGGDGTARNISHKVGDNFPVLGIPAGCKIHSGVYAVTPTAAGRIVELMVTHQLVTLTEADVMDIDESLFREGVVKAKRYGEMQVPAELRYVQATKSGGKEVDELVLQDIAADIIDKMDDALVVIGSGSTTAFLMEELGLKNTLLGVDVVHEQKLLANDVTEPQLWQFLHQYKGNIKLVITLIGGQGHIFGRGNQQLSPRIIREIGKENILIIATKAKLTALDSRPLIADTGDNTLDDELSGFMPVITGYNDQVYYPVSSPQ
ncbi:ATP-NAD kinase family protein [Thalassotalea sp. 1_MG-2023]|uniref:ATP-NAD kinase family protein n=1 Tax=Thalassotalea sp. 1_MG-2023 TaxID=3062680 RepID=UPI0026E1C8AE|nr:ATP-NAD kinase family protein [Thalassotalea sp. 1_MG-2023]MDO6426621.1 ATP-NAD kinase family protein [Thalassotalea sp. 1_MG-2023]